MGISQWSVKHKADIDGVSTAIQGLGFVPVEGRDDMYALKVVMGDYWREMKARVRPHEIVLFIHKEEESTTEVYFDYLVQCGYVLGRVSCRIETLPVVENTEEEEDEVDGDDEELDGYAPVS